MECPKCGRKIPEGHMYCESCGNELHMVPEYDAAVENEIDETLLKMAKEITSGDDGKEHTKGFRLYISKRFLTILGLVCAVLLVAVIAAVIATRPPADPVKEAVSAKEAGDTEGALAFLTEAIEEDPLNGEAILLKAEYELEAGDDAAALDTYDRIVNSVRFNEEETQRAYRATADIYLRRKDYASLYRLMQQCHFEDIKETYLSAMPDGPAFLPGGGSYEEAVSVTLSAQPWSDIYYSLGGGNGTVDENSTPYDGPIILDEDGTYHIRAVAYDKDRVPTLVSEAEYTITMPHVKPPQILEDSGVYTQATKIVAFSENETEIYYTIDGTDPDENSTKYTTPITMPRGKSEFRFVAISAEGEISDVVIREYELSLPRYVSQEQAVANIIQALIEEKVLLDESGRTQGQPGHNVYIVRGIIEVRDSGEYYEVVEQHLNEDGTSEDTGLFYAVNTNTGATYRLGYDSAGRYLLVKLR